MPRKYGDAGKKAPTPMARDASFRDQMLSLMENDSAIRDLVSRMMLESVVVQELRAFREDTNRRFEAVDRRFEAVDRRFEEMMTELKALRTDMDKRFEQMRVDMDKRFEAQRSDMDKRFDLVGVEFKATRDSISALGSRWGIQTEEAVRSFAQEFISKEFGVKAERWTHKDAELDLVVGNGHHCAIEVTSWCDERALRRFLQSVGAYETKTGNHVVRRMIITAHATGAAWKAAQQAGVEICSG